MWYIIKCWVWQNGNRVQNNITQQLDEWWLKIEKMNENFLPYLRSGYWDLLPVMCVDTGSALESHTSVTQTVVTRLEVGVRQGSWGTLKRNIKIHSGLVIPNNFISPGIRFYTLPGLNPSDIWARRFRPATARYPAHSSQKTITMAKYRVWKKTLLTVHCPSS